MTLSQRVEVGKVLWADGRGPCSHGKLSSLLLGWKADTPWLWCKNDGECKCVSKVLLQRSGAEGLGLKGQRYLEAKWLWTCKVKVGPNKGL